MPISIWAEEREIEKYSATQTEDISFDWPYPTEPKFPSGAVCGPTVLGKDQEVAYCNQVLWSFNLSPLGASQLAMLQEKAAAMFFSL